MEEVRAYQDTEGRLHKTKRDALISDFISRVQRLWGRLADVRDRGDPVVIARLLAGAGSTDIRTEFINAMEELDKGLGSI